MDVLIRLGEEDDAPELWLSGTPRHFAGRPNQHTKDGRGRPMVLAGTPEQVQIIVPGPPPDELEALMRGASFIDRENVVVELEDGQRWPFRYSMLEVSRESHQTTVSVIDAIERVRSGVFGKT